MTGIGEAAVNPAKLFVQPGRETASGGMMTMGCSGLGCATALCVAAERGFDCSLCVRHGAFPAPGWWRGGLPMAALRRPSIQVIRNNTNALPWAVLVVLRECYIDPRFPVIGTADANEAVDLALGRARQLRPGAKIQRTAAGEWSAGDITIFCGPAINQATRWRPST